MAVMGWHERLARNGYGFADDRFITVLGGRCLADPLYRASRPNSVGGVARAIDCRRLF